jgi:hypothetical protein
MMTLIEELSMTIARDFGSRWRLLNMIRNLFTVLQIGVLTDYGMSTVLDVADLQLYFVSAKKESCLPLYIVPVSHKIDEKVPPY